MSHIKKKKAKSKSKCFYTSKQKTLRKFIVNRIPLKVVSSSDSRKMILSNKIKMQERIKDNW